MANERDERRLTAILAADVVGYSRLIEADESGTRAALRTLRSEVTDPHIAEHAGRIVSTAGDSILAEFASVVDAVQCAAEIQRAVASRNEGVPEDKRIEFRIGVNLGDVIVEGDDIHGDGVNVAARLEGLADPGGIFISGGAFDQVQNKLELGYENLGPQKVKNIAKPVQVYRVLLAPEAAG
ncbi:MAG: adenylate/guanylate cyclase domain-containing protein, partial [Proteobacteria bacterium]|nr:adenylate/guanylate cyclase domain-containing protein [Pseudomonadota bacterium]